MWQQQQHPRLSLCRELWAGMRCRQLLAGLSILCALKSTDSPRQGAGAFRLPMRTGHRRRTRQRRRSASSGSGRRTRRARCAW